MIALSKRQRQVIELIAEGLGDDAIGARLNVSRSTVKAHVSAIYNKAGTSSRVLAAVMFVRGQIA